jgi:hypothetical protein
MRGFSGVVEIFNAHASSAKNTGFGDALRREWKPKGAALLVHLNEMSAFRPERRILCAGPSSLTVAPDTKD